MAVTIREATTSDIPQLKELDKITVIGITQDKQKNFSQELKTPVSEIIKHHEKAFATFFDLRRNRVYVAADGDRIVGFIWLTDGTEQFTGERYVFVMELMVAKEYQHRGIGRELMKRAEDYCREKNVRWLKLMVSAFNPVAFRLYKSLGYMVEDLYMRKLIS